MKLELRDLSILNYAQGFTLRHAKAPSVAASMEPGFFEPAQDMIAAGDMIHVSAPDGGCILFVTKSPDVVPMALASVPIHGVMKEAA